jgi:hypothetical protein
MDLRSQKLLQGQKGQDLDVKILGQYWVFHVHAGYLGRTNLSIFHATHVYDRARK